jgi:DNA-binding transcriptional regulator LsrR (DeoR family)
MLHTVAKLHYESELSQVQIAKRLGLSTATISRLLQRARSEGIVRIEVRDIFSPDELGAQLAARLALREVVAVDAPAVNVLSALAPPLTRMLTAAGLGRDSVLVIGWGRTVSAVIDAGLPPLPGVMVVPSTGGMLQHAQHFQSNEFSRRAAEVTGGVPCFIHAPYLPAPEALELFLCDPSVQASVVLWDRIDAAVVGIGMPYSLDRPSMGAGDPEPPLAQAAGDVVRHYFDPRGDLIDWRGETGMIAVSAAQLRAAALVVGIAVGEAKVASIIGAARAKLITTLITDTRTAEAVLDQLSREEQGLA